MARNSEKNYSQLNRFILAAEEEKRKKLQRPPLSRLNTPAEIRKWIPSIKSEINFCLRQTSGTRNYPDYKIEEFQERLVELQGEYKRFVNKCKALDPSAAFYTPGEAHGYIGKRKIEAIVEKHESDRANKRAKYGHPTIGETEYSTEDLFNSDGTFKVIDNDAFIASIYDNDVEEEIATPLADPPQSATNQFVPTMTNEATRDGQDQPLYNFIKDSVRSAQVRMNHEKEDEPAEGLSLLANYNSSSDEDE